MQPEMRRLGRHLQRAYDKLQLPIKGADSHEIFSWLKNDFGKSPKWNFYKYLFDRSGKLDSSWSSMTKPDNSKILAKIDNLL